MEATFERIGKKSAVTAQQIAANFKKSMAGLSEKMSDDYFAIIQARTQLRAEEGKQVAAMFKKFSDDEKLMKGGHAGFGAGQMQLMHSARATFDSLISGGNPLTVFMQQAPQVMQALSMMKTGAMDFVKTLLAKPVGPVAIFGGLLAGLAAGAAAAVTQYSKLVNMLKGNDAAAFTPEYILRRNQAAGHLLEVERLIALEVKKQADAYNSVESKSARISELTKERFEHLRRMNDLTGGGQAGALAIDRAERQAELDNLLQKQQDLLAEAAAKRAAAQGMGVIPSAERDRNNIAQKEAQLALAEEAAKEVMAAQQHGGMGATGINTKGLKRDAFIAYNKMTLSDASEADIRAAEKKTIEDRNSLRKQVKAAKELADANDIKREARRVLEEAAGKSTATAAEIGLSLPQQQRRMEQRNRDQAEEFAMGPAMARGYSLNSQQRVGAYAATPPDFKRLVEACNQTAHNTASLKPTGLQSPPGAKPAQFGGRPVSNVGHSGAGY